MKKALNRMSTMKMWRVSSQDDEKEDFMVTSPVVGSKDASISAELSPALTAMGSLKSLTPCFQ